MLETKFGKRSGKRSVILAGRCLFWSEYSNLVSQMKKKKNTFLFQFHIRFHDSYKDKSVARHSKIGPESRGERSAWNSREWLFFWFWKSNFVNDSVLKHPKTKTPDFRPNRNFYKFVGKRHFGGFLSTSLTSRFCAFERPNSEKKL